MITLVDNFTNVPISTAAEKQMCSWQKHSWKGLLKELHVISIAVGNSISFQQKLR